MDIEPSLEESQYLREPMEVKPNRQMENQDSAVAHK